MLISYLDAKGNYGFGKVDKDGNLEPCSDEKPNVFVFNKNFYLGLLPTSTKPDEKNLKIKSEIRKTVVDALVAIYSINFCINIILF